MFPFIGQSNTQPNIPQGNPYDMDWKDKLFAIATSPNGDGRAALAAKGDMRARRQAWNQQQAGHAQQQRAEQIKRSTDFGLQLADSLLATQDPVARSQVLDYYIHNSPEGINGRSLERYRNAPDAVLRAERQRALTIQERIEQGNNQRDYELKAEDTRADNARELADTNSQIADRTADNVHQTRILDETIRNNDLTHQRGTYANQTRRMNADTARMEAEQAAEAAQYERANPKPKTFNQAQATAAGFASRAEAANNDLMASGYDPTKGLGVGDRLGLRPDALRVYEAQKREFINAVLRKESGAAISKQEFENAEAMFFPSRLDGPEAVEQKALIRQRAIDAMKAESQGAHEALFPQSQATNDPLGIR